MGAKQSKDKSGLAGGNPSINNPSASNAKEGKRKEKRSDKSPRKRSNSETEAELLRSQMKNKELEKKITELKIKLNQTMTERGSKGASAYDQKTPQRGKSGKIFVMAIDFGTCYSGFAHSLAGREEFIGTALFDQEPTVVLLDPNKQFHAFGQKAKDHYAEQVKEKTEKDWYYFEHFKMKLFTQSGTLNKDMRLTDATGKLLPALDVFAAAIKYMTETFLASIRHTGEYTIADTHVILTVPAIWHDPSKSFMRQAAVKAGIPDDSLTLALEPEAASLFCIDKMSDKLKTQGTGYIVADLGGGTADFTCHEVNENGKLRELHIPIGGDFGGTAVDHAFRDLLNKIFGADMIQNFQKKNNDNYHELFSTFEVKKRTFDGTHGLTFRFPAALLNLFEETVGQSVQESLRNSAYNDQIEFKRDKISISISLARKLFDPAISKIVDNLKSLIQAIPSVKHLLFVGGFSSSLYLQEEMNQIFDETEQSNNRKLEIHFIPEPHLAVVKGAVIYGLQTSAIESRKCKYTYGIARMMRFKKHHSSKKRVVIKGVEWCDGLFNKHIEVGTTVRVGDDYPVQEYFPLTSDMKQGVLEVYASKEKNPTYIDDTGCQLVGLVKIELSGGDVNTKVLVRLVFGGTEIRIEATEEITGKVTVGYMDFLG